MKNGKILNSLIAAGALFGASMLPQKADAAQIEKPQVVQSSSLNQISLTTEESGVARYLFLLISYNLNGQSDAIKLDEMKYVAKTLATYQCKFRNGSVYDSLLRAKAIKLNAPPITSLSTSNKVFLKAAEYAQILMNNPESIKWDFGNGADPVIFVPKGTKVPVDSNYEYKQRISSDWFTYYFVKSKNSQNAQVQPQINAPQKNNINAVTPNKLTDQANFVGKVIYSETSSICTPDEVKLVCQVIFNRIGQRDFGTWNGKKMVASANAYEVVKSPNAFSAVKPGRHNIPWKDYDRLSNNPNVLNCKKLGVALMNNDRSILDGLNGYKDLDKIVYYHDKTIELPDGWINRYYLPVEVFRTTNFVFYKVVPNTRHLTAKQYKAELIKKK